MDEHLLRYANAAAVALEMCGADDTVDVFLRRLEQHDELLAPFAGRVAADGALSVQEMLNRLGSESYCAARWAHFGFQLFDLTDSLTASLLMTDTTSLQPRDVHFPFGTFMIRIPDGYIPIDMGESGRFWMRHILVSRFNSEERGDCLRLQGTASAFSGSGGMLWVNEAIDRFADPAFYDYRAMRVSFDRDPAPVPIDTISMQAMTRLALNVCQWIEANDGLKTAKHRPSRTMGPRSRRAIYPATWVLGREVKVGHKVLAEARRMAVAGHTRSGWTLHVRSWVRGHFKMQPYGEQMSKRKRIWIAPYERGPDDAPGVVRPYSCDE